MPGLAGGFCALAAEAAGAGRRRIPRSRTPPPGPGVLDDAAAGPATIRSTQPTAGRRPRSIARTTCEWERNDLEDCEAENVTTWECFDRETDRCYASADVATADGGACDAADAGFHVCRVYPDYDAYSEEEQAMLAENCTTEVLSAWVDDCATQDILGVCSFSSEGTYPMELYFYPPTPLEDARAVCADGGGTWSGA